jgi:hypothetical protein
MTEVEAEVKIVAIICGGRSDGDAREDGRRY